jgi:hypothetical protein
MYVSFTKWKQEKLYQFRREHPELEKYWVDPSKPNGGVAWIE